MLIVVLNSNEFSFLHMFSRVSINFTGVQDITEGGGIEEYNSRFQHYTRIHILKYGFEYTNLYPYHRTVEPP